MTGHVVSLIMPWNGRQNGGRSFGKAAGGMKVKLEGEEEVIGAWEGEQRWREWRGGAEERGGRRRKRKGSIC